MRTLHEVVELTRNCDLGEQGERAVVVSLDGHSSRQYITLVFFDRPEYSRLIHTGADYRFLKTVTEGR